MRFWATLLVAILAPAAVAGADWRLEKDADGIQIYTRAVEGWAIREMRGVTTFKGRLSSLVAVIDDVEQSQSLNEFVVKSSVVQRDSPMRYQVYTLTKMPWPLADRDVVNQHEVAQDAATRAVTITDTAIDGGVSQKKELIRITRSRQQWTLTPADNGSVAIELRILSDPAGSIPTSLINTLSVSTPFNTITKLKKLAVEPRYADAQLPYVKEPPGTP